MMTRRLACVAALLLGIPASVAAQPDLPPTPGQQARKAAEDCESTAKAEREGYDTCALLYLDIYNKAPEAVGGDEVLYNAGVLFEEGHSFAKAAQMYGLVRKFYSKSKLAGRATARTGKLYGDIAMYDKAAEQLEEYARRYAGEKDAYDAMSDAVFYRKAIGDDDKAIEGTKYFIRTFGAKKPREAANAHFSLITIYEKRRDRDAAVKHLREYIRIYGAKGGDDRLVIAYAKIGQILWEQSCPVKAIDGLCMRVERARRTPPAHCGPTAPVALTVVKRDENLVKDAFVSFASAAKQFERVGGRTGGDDGGARYYYATAKLAVADRAFEAYASLAVPRELTLEPDAPNRPKSQKRFAEWLEDAKQRSTMLLQLYEHVLMIKDAATAIAAAERIARIQEVFASALLTAQLPAAMRTGPKKTEQAKAYCDELATDGEPLRAQARVSYGVCLSKATELGWFDDAARICERALGRLAPDEVPPLRERTARASNDAPLIALEPPLR